MLVELLRLEKNNKQTFGVLKIDGEVFCVTLERPWLHNIEYISCIYSGMYTCKRVDSPNHGNTFEITNVQDRTNVLFHIGNIVKDTQGCILLGRMFGELKGERAILHSSTAFHMFLKRLENIDSFNLAIY